MGTRETLPVLLIDWGIGGLSVYKEIKRRTPDVACLYISDSGFTPYGKVPAEQLTFRLAQLIRIASDLHRLSRVVIACNAASTVLDRVQKLFSLPMMGMIEAGVDLVRASGAREIGVIGGLRTVEAKVFSSALAPLGFTVREEVAQPLSALIEAGILAGAELEKELRRILAPLHGVEALLLACTHYPAIAKEIQKVLPSAKLLDPAERVALQLEAALGKAAAPFSGADQFFTTGSVVGTENAADLAFGIRAKFAPLEVRDER